MGLNGVEIRSEPRSEEFGTRSGECHYAAFER